MIVCVKSMTLFQGHLDLGDDCILPESVYHFN